MHQPSESQWSSQGHSNPAAYSHSTPHQQSWPNQNHQMQHSQYPNVMQGMNPMNFPFIPQQVIHDALAMSAPVEAADEPTLVQAILSSRNKGETYKDALNSLHGKNGHSASLWKDYYLEHKDRLDAWIAMCIEADAQKTTATTKKPMVLKQMLKSESSPSVASKSSPAPSATKQKQKNRECASTKSNAPNLPRVGRTTQNSLSAPTPVYDDRLPPPNAEIRIPSPPSRSPSPPRHIVPQGRGNKYTPEDRDFFIRFISWRLKGNPCLTRMDLCEQLAEKAPHHTSQSWASYWSNHHDVPDKILAAAQGGSEDEDESESSSAEDKDKFPLKRRPKYYESGSSSEEDRPSTSLDDEGDSAQDEDDEDEDEDGDDADGPVRLYSENEMGSKGAPFTDADLYITAKYVAFFSDFENATTRERWDPYHELVSETAWSCLKHHSDFTSIPNGLQKPGLSIIVDTSTPSSGSQLEFFAKRS
ncbi:hypothetical protein AX14_010581 [Amanita brunnescens Koide BX004]|nr:hypothetical protein AX14_010581 [Amanita brunnescens Koide BX004]